MRLLFFFLILFTPICVHSQIITTYAGNGIGDTARGDGGIATSGSVAAPWGLNFDNFGNLLICQANFVREVDKLTGIISTIAGSDTATDGAWGDNGPALNAFIFRPSAVCLDSLGNYYIADHWYSEVRIVYSSTSIIDTLVVSQFENVPHIAAHFF